MVYRYLSFIFASQLIIGTAYADLPGLKVRCEDVQLYDGQNLLQAVYSHRAAIRGACGRVEERPTSEPRDERMVDGRQLGNVVSALNLTQLNLAQCEIHLKRRVGVVLVKELGNIAKVCGQMSDSLQNAFAACDEESAFATNDHEGRELKQILQFERDHLKKHSVRNQMRVLGTSHDSEYIPNLLRRFMFQQTEVERIGSVLDAVIKDIKGVPECRPTRLELKKYRINYQRGLAASIPKFREHLVDFEQKVEVLRKNLMSVDPRHDFGEPAKQTPSDPQMSSGNK